MDNPQKPTLSWQTPPAVPAKTNQTPPPSAPKTPPPPPKKTAEQKQGVGASGYVGVFVGGLIIGALLGWGVVSMHTSGSSTAMIASSTAATMDMSSSTATTGSTAVDVSSAAVGGLGGLTIPSPQQSGFAVGVSQVSVTQPTWVVVYEDQDGLPGNALGAELFYPASQGGATSGAVQLLRGTLPGQTYLAGESVDDGDHIFSLQNDKPVRDSEGNPLFVSFTTN